MRDIDFNMIDTLPAFIELIVAGKTDNLKNNNIKYDIFSNRSSESN